MNNLRKQILLIYTPIDSYSAYHLFNRMTSYYPPAKAAWASNNRRKMGGFVLAIDNEMRRMAKEKLVRIKVKPNHYELTSKGVDEAKPLWIQAMVRRFISDINDLMRGEE